MLTPVTQTRRLRSDVQFVLSVANRRASRFDHFEKHLHRAEQLGWPGEEVALQRWLATAQRGHVELVEPQLNRLIAAGATDEVAEEVYEALAEGYLATHRLKEAWKCLSYWSDWRPAAIKPRLLRGSICQQIGNSEQAAEEYRLLLKNNPSHVTGMAKLAHVLLETNHVQEAVDQFQRVLRLEPANVEMTLGLASGERRLGHAPTARQHLSHALTLKMNPLQQAECLSELGELDFEDGKYAQAIEHLQQAIELTPREARMHHALSRALLLAGQPEAAQRHVELNRELQTKSQRLHDITKTLFDQPQNADLRFEAGSILMEQGFQREAVGWLETAIACQPEHVPAHQALSAYFEAQGDTKSAARHRLLAQRAIKSATPKQLDP